MGISSPSEQKKKNANCCPLLSLFLSFALSSLAQESVSFLNGAGSVDFQVEFGRSAPSLKYNEGQDWVTLHSLGAHCPSGGVPTWMDGAWTCQAPGTTVKRSVEEESNSDLEGKIKQLSAQVDMLRTQVAQLTKEVRSKK